MLTSLQAVRGVEALHSLYYRGGRYHLWIILLTAAPLVAFGDVVMHLYAGQQYALAASVMVPLLAIYPLTWASAMYYRIAHAVGRVGAYYACDLVVQLTTLALLFYVVAVRDLGAPGAARAIALSQGLLHVMLVWPLGLRLVAGRWSRFFRETLLPGILPFGAALLAAWIFRQLVQPDRWSELLIGSAVAALVYVVVLLLFCLDANDRELLDRVRQRFRRTLPSEGTRFGWRGQST
jgi:O-antigen/teichoic acid export membrane protein